MALTTSDKIIKCRNQAPKVNRNWSAKTFLSTFLVQLFESVFFLYMPPHYTITQCMECQLCFSFIGVRPQLKENDCPA